MEARELKLWKTAMRNALSDGLYHIEKYIMLADTIPASGIPRKKRAMSNPAAVLHAAMQMTIVPKRKQAIGRYTFADIFFIKRLDGRRPAVAAKYVIDTAQLKSVPLRPKECSREFGVPDPKILTLPLSLSVSLLWMEFEPTHKFPRSR